MQFLKGLRRGDLSSLEVCLHRNSQKAWKTSAGKTLLQEALDLVEADLRRLAALSLPYA